jgi:hypothetical protein
MKIFRSLTTVLFMSTFDLTTVTQKNNEITKLRTKTIKNNGITQYNLDLTYAQNHGITTNPVETFV